MWSGSLFVFLSLMYGVLGAETDETEPVTVTEGDSVTLHTNLSEVLNDDTILWMFGPKDSLISQIKRKDEVTSFVVSDDVEIVRGRLQVEQKTGSLTIRNTRIRHSGQYKLTISRKKTTTKIFSVTVIGVVAETDGVRSVSVTEGQSVTLPPDAEMHKDALMLWRFGDKGILLAKIDVETNETMLNDADERFRQRLQLSLNGSLTIKNTRTTDSGLYELQIRGSESSRQFLLSVNALPGLSSGAIAGIVFGVLIFVLLFGAIAFGMIYCCRKDSKLEKQMAAVYEEKEESVTEEDSLTLPTGLTEIRSNDTIEWYHETDDNRIAEINGETRRSSTGDGADGRFRSKLMLDERTGDLTIRNIRSIHSGLYKLKISSSSCCRRTLKTKHKRFILKVNVSVKEGRSVLLQSAAEVHADDLILWTFGPENCLVVKSESGKMSTGERFKGRLDLNKTNGELTIRNIRTTESGLFKLQIVNSDQTTFRRLNVTVTDSTGEQENDLTTVVTPLLNEDVIDGVNELQATSSV